VLADVDDRAVDLFELEEVAAEDRGEGLDRAGQVVRGEGIRVFFIVSVATTSELSPSTWAAVKSPSSAIATVRSRSRCGVVSRPTRTRRIAALP
jgi:hypothetical protein